MPCYWVGKHHACMMKSKCLRKAFKAPWDLAPDRHLALCILALYQWAVLNSLNFLEVFLLSLILEAFARAALPLSGMPLSSLLPTSHSPCRHLQEALKSG